MRAEGALDAPARTGPSLAEALLPLGAMLFLFALGLAFVEPSTEMLVVVLLGATAVAGGMGRRHGVGWDDIQGATGAKVAAVLPALLILLAIGMLVATWILSGTIPFLVYWGVQSISPRYLILTAFLATAVMSVVTGTSWGSAGTVGVALMGTAAALDAPLAATAGAVVSGAYLGDKMSALSDTTNIAAIGAGVELYAHIRHMLWTAVPSSLVACVVYLLAAGPAPPGSGPPSGALALLADLRGAFSLGWPVLLPPAVIAWSIARRTPPVLALALSSLVAACVGIAVQGFGPGDAVVAAVAGFRVDLLAAVGVDPVTVGADLATLVSRGGLYGMAPTLVVILAAFLLAGAMEASGALDVILARMLASVDGVFGLIASTLGSGGVMVALTSHAGVTALVVGELFRGAYDERGVDRLNLSRSIEDSATITEVLMPWTVTGVFMATTLGVPTTAYAPWAVFCYGGPVFSLGLAALYRRTGRGLGHSVRPPTAPLDRESP